VNPGKWLRSSSFRLALIYMALFGGSVLLLLTFIYWSTARYMAQQADATIEAEIAGLAERYRTSGLSGLTNTISERISRKPGGYSIYLLADDDLRPLVGNISRWPPGRATQDGWLDFRLEGEGWPAGEIHRARARAFQLRGGFHLLVGRDLHELERTEQLIVRTLVWGLAITLVLGLIGGSMMSRSLVRRIEAVNQTSREIMSGDLSRRITMDRSGDDFDELAGNLNAMLDRITSLMEEVRRISDNIAHDLKTPLSRLKNSLELLQTGNAKDAKNRSSLIEQSIAEADGLLSTFNALLRIARIESGERRAAFAGVDLQQLLHDVVEFYAPLAEDRQQSLELSVNAAAVVPGDRDLLFQAFANLLDNAIKYTPPQGYIKVDLSEQNEQPWVTFTDSGPGIPEQERDKVFQRFYRLEQSRGTPGNGLGLSLVAAVAKLHDIKLKVKDNTPGLRVVMEFTRSDG
jgi:signal transduction histidine kinase